MAFETLLSPLKIGNITLKNRVMMGSMHTGLEEHPDGSSRLAAFYAERARGGVGLIVTGGFAPNAAGRVFEEGAELVSEDQLDFHRHFVKAVHENGGKIALQILHTGRYGLLENCVAPSPITAPINFYRPKELTNEEIVQTIEDFVRCAKLAKIAGYDGVEIMGSEGYLINQFIAKCTNVRTDEWGGSYENRIRFALRIVEGVKEESGEDFLIIYRLSCLDLVENGSSFEEVIELGQRVEKAGASLINTGIGWHEARIPTIAMMVPRAAFAWVTGKLRPHLKIPIVTSNRINDPYVAECLLRDGLADMVSMARPLLADENFVNKTAEGRPEEINTCIACNQACLDQIFQMKTATCMVNPRAGHETELNYEPAAISKSIAVIGAGPAGMTAAYISAMRGHRVTLFDQRSKLGGQINLAVKIPGKQEFYETLRFYRVMLEKYGVELKLGQCVNQDTIVAGNYDAVVLATGVRPRELELEGADHAKVLSYLDVLDKECPVGNKVAVIGAGGIGIDVAHFLTAQTPYSGDVPEYLQGYGILDSEKALALRKPKKREVTVFQRSTDKIGKRLGKTTGWAHIQTLKSHGVQLLPGATYLKIDDSGLHVKVALKKGEEPQEIVMDVDNVIVAAGQEPRRELETSLRESGFEVHVIGGARQTLGLDAKTAINDAAELAAKF
ncbi:MAG: NADPH-dependent 2,4-dienoyl-CoA reductase [SAR324 cluster bacterium]|nr:NADPH-dependent 2,4-dienoyl-CoA reductase [SAR324 cluster bacterium]